MPALSQALHRVTSRIESASALERPAGAISGLFAKFFPDGPVKDTLSGTWLGHPLHPLLVGLPIGAWASASVLDLTGGPAAAPAAKKLVGFGLLAALPTVASGGSDWVDTTGAERRVGLVHWAGAWTTIALYYASWRVRAAGRSGTTLALAGAGALSATGYLGGHLAYAMGVGVDTTAFQAGPQDWAKVAAEDDLGEDDLRQVRVDGVAILLVRRAGALYALADRCTHRGAPLSDGELEGDRDGGCIVCPWHGSKFALEDGSVEGGPATLPQPAYAVKVEDGQIFVRRSEERSLRTNPI